MSYKEQLQKLWRLYEEEHGVEASTIRDCFDWASRKGLWQPKPQDVSKIFGRDMADALRQETRVDSSGRIYRAKHCIRENENGIQLRLWGDIDKSPRSFMEKSFQQRRKGIVNDGYQLKMDVDHFNEFRASDEPIQLVLDISDDVAELEALNKKEIDDEAA